MEIITVCKYYYGVPAELLAVGSVAVDSQPMVKSDYQHESKRSAMARIRAIADPM